MKSEQKIQEQKQYNESIVRRINLVKQTLSITTHDIAKVSGIAYNTVQKQLQLVNGIDPRVISALAELAPNVSVRWIMTGSEEIGSFIPHKTVVEKEDYTELKERVRTLEETIKKLAISIEKNNKKG